MKALRTFWLCIAAGVGCTSYALCPVLASERAVPNFSSGQYGWIAVDNEFIKPPSGPGPVTFDPAHPYVGNNKGGQPNYRVADLTNPILKPFAIERLKQAN